jgi:hypothetical protein
MVKHWFQCWLANVSLVVCGIKLSNPENKISLISAHAFRPGPIQRNPNLPAELAGFEYDDFFFAKAVRAAMQHQRGIGKFLLYLIMLFFIRSNGLVLRRRV